MLKKIVRQYKNLRVVVPGWLKKSDAQGKKDYIELKKKQVLVSSILDLIRQRKIQWSVSELSKLAISTLTQDSVIVVQEMTAPSSKRYGGTAYTNVLTLFDGGEEVLVIKECHDGSDYDESSAFFGYFPILDLYDLATKGERREGCLEHSCGLTGFNPVENVCYACEGKRRLPHSAIKLPY